MGLLSSSNGPPTSPKLRAGRPGTRYPLSSPRQIRRPRQIIYLMVIFMLLYWFGVRHGLGIERAPPPPLGFAVKGGRKSRAVSSLTWGKLGMATVRELPLEQRARQEHPIYELMERAEERWYNLINAQSQTLEQAVREYKRRYILDPPAGFDVWFAWCQAHNVTFVDEYDQLMKDLLVHHALKPETYIQRAKDLHDSDFTYTLDISPSNLALSGPKGNMPRPKTFLDLISGFQHDLPRGFALRVTGSEHDTGSDVVGRDQRNRAMQHVRDGTLCAYVDHADFVDAELKRLEDPNRNNLFGWFKQCLPTDAANIRPKAEDPLPGPQPKSFIHDHLPTMEYCDFPELKRLHGALSLDYFDRTKSRMTPRLVLSKIPGDASHQMTPLQAYDNVTEEDLPYLPRWEDKTDNRIFWRGSMTGGYNIQRDWRESHRLRLHLMMNGPKGGSRAWDSAERETMIPTERGGFEMVTRKDKVLSKAYAEVKLSGKVHQCPREMNGCQEIADEIEFGENISPTKAEVFKYNLDLDGNGWSSRFHRLLTGGSPVIKSTMFPEWNMETMIPWLHYIPLKHDNSDLYDIASFFIGPIDEHGNVDTKLGHDHLARKIGEAGQAFAVHHWGWKEMQAYTFRLLLELRRLQSLDRRSMSFRLPNVPPK